MMQIPQIQIRQQSAQISIDADLGRQELQQPKAIMEMKQVRPEQHFNTTPAKLEINQEAAWDALGMGSHLKVASTIYSMSSDMALQGLARMVEQGNRMAAIHQGGNPIAERGAEWRESFSQYDFRGQASYSNVSFNYTPAKVTTETTRAGVQIQIDPQQPIHRYERGKLDIHPTRYAKVEFIPPQLDLLM